MKEVDIEAEKRILERMHIEMLVDQTPDLDDVMKHVANDAIRSIHLIAQQAV